MIAFFKRHLDAKWIEIERDALRERNEELSRTNDDLNDAVYEAREERNKLHKECHDNIYRICCIRESFEIQYR